MMERGVFPERKVKSGWSSDGFEEVAEVGHVGFDGGDLGGVGWGVAGSGVSLVAGAAEAVGEGFGWAGAAAVGAFDEDPAGGGGSVGRGACAGRQPGRDLVDEAAADQADGGVDLGGESYGEGVGEVVGGDTAVEPSCCEGFEGVAVVGGEGEAVVVAAEAGEGEVGGGGCRTPGGRCGFGIRAPGWSALVRYDGGGEALLGSRAPRLSGRWRFLGRGPRGRRSRVGGRGLCCGGGGRGLRGCCGGRWRWGLPVRWWGLWVARVLRCGGRFRWRGRWSTMRCRGRCGTRRCGRPSGFRRPCRQGTERVAGVRRRRGR